MPPVNPLYRIVDLIKGPDFSCRVDLDPSHQILQGHFPGNPVLPGAWLIRTIHDTIEQITEKKLKMHHASQVKFLQPVIPGEYLAFSIRGEISQVEEKAWKVNAVVFHQDTTFVKFKGTFIESGS